MSLTYLFQAKYDKIDYISYYDVSQPFWIHCVHLQAACKYTLVEL
jgi:hypothetical protein